MLGLNQEFCEILITCFAHFLWQGLLLGAAFEVLMWMLKNRSPQSRHACGLFCLLIFSLCVPMTYLVVRNSDIPNPELIVSAIETNSNLNEMISLNNMEPSQRPALSSKSTLVINDTATATDHPWNFHRTAPLLLGLYFVGVLFFACRLAMGVYIGRSYRQHAMPVTQPEFIASIEKVTRQVGLAIKPPVMWCQQVAVPSVVGILKPTVLLPLACLTQLQPAQLEQILIHELTHIRRYDHLFNLAQNVLEAVLFFHPVVWFISRRVRLEREFCCDAAVVASGSVAEEYANSLIDVAQLSQSMKLRSLPVAVPAVEKPSKLGVRIDRILGRHQRQKNHLFETGSLITVATVLGLCCLFAVQFPTVADSNDNKPTTDNLGPVIEVEPTQKVNRKGNSIEFRVIDTEGKPIEGMRFLADGFANILEEVRGKTNAKGIWIFKKTSNKSQHFQIYRNGYLGHPQASDFSPNDSPVTLKFRKSIPVIGTIVDAETGKPIKKYRLYQGIHFKANPLERWSWDQERSGPHVPVKGSWAEGLIDPNSGPVIEPGKFMTDLKTLDRIIKFRIEAGGYLPQITNEMDAATLSGKAIKLKFRLKKNAGLERVVLTPDGKPASGARVAFIVRKEGNSRTLRLINGISEVTGFDAPSALVLANGEGRFILPALNGQFACAITNKDGYLNVDDISLAKQEKLRLKPWSTVEGTVYYEGKPAAGVTVTGYYFSLVENRNLMNPDIPMINYHQEVKTDQAGKFKLLKGIPGKWKLFAYYDSIIKNKQEQINGKPPLRNDHAAVVVNLAAGERLNQDIGKQIEKLKKEESEQKTADKKIDRTQKPALSEIEKKLIGTWDSSSFLVGAKMIYMKNRTYRYEYTQFKENPRVGKWHVENGTELVYETTEDGGKTFKTTRYQIVSIDDKKLKFKPLSPKMPKKVITYTLISKSILLGKNTERNTKKPSSDETKKSSKPTLEFRIAQKESGEGLTETKVEDKDEIIYMHKSAFITDADIKFAKVTKENGGSTAIQFELTPDAAKRMLKTTKENIGKKLVIIIEGKVMMAPKINAAISKSGIISGSFTEKEAERIVKAIWTKGEDKTIKEKLKLAGKATISGRIVMPDMSPATVKGEMHYVVRNKNGRSDGSDIQKNDQFSIVVPAGKVWLTYYPKGYSHVELGPFDLKPGEKKKDIKIVLDSGISVKAIVGVSIGNPIPGATVRVYPYLKGMGGAPYNELTTNSNGECQLEHLVNRSYYNLYVTAPGYLPLFTAPLRVEEGQELLATMVRSIPGTAIIRFADGTPAPFSKLYIKREITSRGEVIEYGNEGEGYWGKVFTKTDGNGRFKMNKLETGSQYLFIVEAVDGSRGIVRHLKAGQVDMQITLPRRRDLLVKMTGDINKLPQKNGKPFLSMRQKIVFETKSGKKYTDIIGADFPIEYVKNSKTVIFRGLAVDLGAGQINQQVEVMLDNDEKTKNNSMLINLPAFDRAVGNSDHRCGNRGFAFAMPFTYLIYDLVKLVNVFTASQFVFQIFRDSKFCTVPACKFSEQDAAVFIILIHHQRKMSDEKIDNFFGRWFRDFCFTRTGSFNFLKYPRIHQSASANGNCCATCFSPNTECIFNSFDIAITDDRHVFNRFHSLANSVQIHFSSKTL
jgi:beta-lactamase regulating signal transducer with metallopeptidase domain